MSDLVIEGLNLAMVGMGFVFTFLALLVVLTMLMSSLVLRLSGGSGGELPGEVSNRGPEAGPAPADEARVVAIISAAVRQHRDSHRGSRD